MEYYYSAATRNKLARWVFAFIIAALLYHYFSNTLLHQLQSPVFTSSNVDPTYIFFNSLHIPVYITSHYWIALTFDILFFLFALLSIIFPSRVVFIIPFTLLFFLYVICYNTYGMHHVHSLYGILLITIPFWASDKKKFTFLWDGLRYFTLLIYSLSFIWKVFRGSLFHSHQAIAILKTNLAPYLLFNPNSFQSHVYYFFIQHQDLLQCMYIVAILMEGSFLIGFFTKKYDYVLIVFAIVFHLSIVFFVDAFFVEFLILLFTLIKLPKQEANFKKGCEAVLAA